MRATVRVPRAIAAGSQLQFPAPCSCRTNYTHHTSATSLYSLTCSPYWVRSVCCDSSRLWLQTQSSRSRDCSAWHALDYRASSLLLCPPLLFRLLPSGISSLLSPPPSASETVAHTWPCPH